MAPAEMEDITIHDLIREHLQVDKDAQNITQAIQNNASQVQTSRGKIKLQDAKWDDGLIMFKKQMWVPNPCIVDVIKEVHCQKATGHPGQRKTMKMINRGFI